MANKLKKGIDFLEMGKENWKILNEYYLLKSTVKATIEQLEVDLKKTESKEAIVAIEYFSYRTKEKLGLI